MRKKLRLNSITLLALLWMVPIWQVFGQNLQIQGKVTDLATGEVLPGVSIAVKGVNTGTTSNLDGIYNISVPKGSVLVFSFVGYATEERTVENAQSIDVAMITDVTKLGEVVVIGYGTVKKGDATGAVNVVGSKDFNKGAITSPQDLLVGKSAGVVITDANGAPGSGATIRIRGGSSLNASNDPLIIVDGVPIDNTAVNGSSNILSFINPNDIESFTILKDASATAIYGSRASNGVIIITTKKGTKGEALKISYNGSVSVSTIAKYMDVYSGDQLRQIAASPTLLNINGPSSLSILGDQNTNWQKQIFKASVSSDHNLSLTGSYKTLPYRFSIGHTDNNGIMKNTGFKRETGSINLNPSFLNNSLKVNFNVKGEYTNINYGDAGSLGSAIAMDPTQPIYENNTSTYWQWVNHGSSLGTPNPLEQVMDRDNAAIVKRGMGNIQLDYTNPAIPELHANLNLGTDYSKSDGHNNLPTNAPGTLTGTDWGRVGIYNGKNYNNILEFYLNYAKDIDAMHSKIDVTGGYSWQHFKQEKYNYDHSVVDETHAYEKIDSTSSITENYLVSFFGRLNYTIFDRYLLTFTLRDDGSSRFSSTNRWGLFPSAALAWKIKDESFLKNVQSITDLKLRLGYGVTGQQNIVGNDYPSQALYISGYSGAYYQMGTDNFVQTLRPNAYDPNIKWEETTTQNIGLDFGFFKSRVTGSFDYYKRVTDRLLENVPIAMGANYSNYLWTNVGSLQNIGYELTLNLIPISKKDMSLNIGFNLTYNQNKITKLSLSNDPSFTIQEANVDLSSGYLEVNKVGSPAHSFFMNKQVYDAQGNPIEGVYVDLSGEGGALYQTTKDRYIDHNPMPDYTMGISARFNWKNLDISASGRSSLGNYAYNQVAASASYNQMYTLGYWRNEPTYLSDTKFVNRQYTSDYFVQNASFFKLDNASIGYNINKIYKKLDLRISFTAQNVFVITSYKGQDPEVGYNNNNYGIDNNYYPRARTYLIGVSLTY
ncbi:MAG TPA: TonB-dependent receptor [Bacteroidales bacterium]